MKQLKKNRNVILRILDIFVIGASYYIAEIIVDNKFYMTDELNKTMMTTIIIAIIIYIGTLHFFKTYKNITRYENGNDYMVYVLACLISYIIITLIGIFFDINIADQRVNMVAALIIVTTIIGYRVTLRLILTEWPYQSNQNQKQNQDKKNVLIIGARRSCKNIN